MKLLPTIHGHGDLVKLSDAERVELCAEIREFIVSHVAKTGGHLASNLGVVELTVAIETVFDTALDRLVFDVGHQAYIHKLLTGRQADFERLRMYEGMSGFPKPHESQTDSFVAGHASSAVSIALGMARARKLTGKKYNVVALVGDGAATGGMVYEALNDAGASREPMVVILNDNEMSIDPNVGGMASHLRNLRTKESYFSFKKSFRAMTARIPHGESIYRFTHKTKELLKRSLLRKSMFEYMGFEYIGPLDGHDMPELIRLLTAARDMEKPVLVHVITQKGRGFAPAEKEPSKYHGVGKFDPADGHALAAKKTTFSDVFGQTMVELAREDKRVCAITAAMPGGTGLIPFKKAFPKRIFDVGIAEEHAVSLAGGLA
ncbi:MAG: 1-deoxy-D-xylulose-5-phosphate synthase, partial [Oscillospiraceae bacterium]|nr:1-deoxy-D-xylulose-5-phosphate synthase [Oscillospiraceae bacterium]